MTTEAASETTDAEESAIAPIENGIRQFGRFRVLTTEERTRGLHEGIRRCETHVAHAHREGANGRAMHRAKGSPPLHKQPEREADLARSIRPTQDPLPEQHVDDLRRFDKLAAKTRDEIISNPLWIAANHIERTTKLVSAEQLLRDDPEIAKARDVLTKASDAVVKSKRALGRHNAKPTWQRATQDFFFGTSEHLNETFSKASHQLLDMKIETEKTEREGRYRHETNASEQNQAAQHRQNLAAREREQLERPLRDVLLERSMAQALVAQNRSVHHLKDAPANEILDLVAIRRDREFPVLELRSQNGDLYLADQVSHDHKALTPGDKIRFAIDDHGTRELSVAARGPDRYLGKERLEGRVAATHWEGEKLVKLELKDARTQKPLSIIPKGDDLRAELGEVKALSLKPGDTVRLQEGQVHLLGRAKSRSESRGR